MPCPFVNLALSLSVPQFPVCTYVPCLFGFFCVGIVQGITILPYDTGLLKKNTLKVVRSAFYGELGARYLA